MPTTLVLSQREVKQLLSMDRVVEAVEGAFLAHGRGATQMPSKVYLSLPEHDGDFRAMPSSMDGAAGVKWVNSHASNPLKHGLPSVMGLYVLSDPETALPLAIMDATWLTAMRTGAAGAVASKHLAKKSVRSIGFVGCGVQSRVLLEAHRVVYGSDLELRMSDLSFDAATRFATEAGGRVTSVEEACGADIVCASTPGRAVVVRASNVARGAHINAIGADAPGKREVETSVLKGARVFVDDWEQATHSGEVNVPLHEGAYVREEIVGTLGELLAQKVVGRRDEDEITLFDSTGLAVQDLAVARVVYALAKEQGVGTPMEIVG